MDIEAPLHPFAASEAIAWAWGHTRPARKPQAALSTIINGMLVVAEESQAASPISGRGRLTRAGQARLEEYAATPLARLAPRPGCHVPGRQAGDR